MKTFKGIFGIGILATSIGLTSCYSSHYGSHHHHGSHYGSHTTGVGAFVGGVLGAVFGEAFQGYDGNLFGSTVGTLAGAAVGNEIEKGQAMRHQNKQSDAYFEHLDQENLGANESYEDLNTLGI
ncbi:MAG: glycine zipper domain-containing protein, partial [Bacteroidaceae bacterium]